jgi:hypothetical protein
MRPTFLGLHAKASSSIPPDESLKVLPRKRLLLPDHGYHLYLAMAINKPAAVPPREPPRLTPWIVPG